MSIIHNAPWPGPPFDPMEDVTFRGTRLADLTREDAIEALRQALIELHRRDAPFLFDFWPKPSPSPQKTEG